MDSFKTFMSIFERAIVERNSTNLTSILNDSRRYFQNITRDDSELVLSILFDKNKGLLCFIQNELRKPISQKGFDMSIKEAFHLLEFIMEQFSKSFVPYIIEAKDTCQMALTTKCSSYIQKAACIAFNKLIELFKEYEIQLGETIKTFVSLFSLIDIKERSLVFSVLGTISKHNPEVSEIHEYSNIIFQQLRNDFKKQYKPQATSQAVEIQIYLDVLTDMLEELPNDMKTKYCSEIYEWIKSLSPPEKYQTKKVIMRSAIYLLSRNIHLFREFVYRDYKFWYNLFINLAQEKNVSHSECGQHALKNLYRMIGKILKHKNSDEDKEVFLYFKNLFENQLKTNQHVNSNMLRFIVYGFSQMAAPCKRYLTDNDVKDMFSLIAHCAMPLCAREDLRQAHLESICDYQEALSEIILHTLDLSTDQINKITKLSILLVKRFPGFSVSGQTLAVSSLVKTITNIGTINKRLLEEFLYNLIHDGVIWTCSHTLLVDAELQRGLQNLPERPVCYKNYLPLWSQLLKPNRYRDHTQIAQDIVDSMMNACVILISKLNLNTKVKDDNVFSDASLSQTAENEGDFKIFINIVDLYVDIIKGLESTLFRNTLRKVLINIISISYKHPLISGFYKLVHTCFKHISNLPKDQVETEILELLYKYLMNTLDLITAFSNELLTTCLYLILDTPIMYVEHILNRTVPVFKMAFTMGLSDFELARSALNTLESWTSHLNRRSIKDFLRQVVPLLEPYLQSKESSTEVLQDIIKSERKVIKRIILIDDENTLERFQMRILLFIASLDTDVIMDFIYKRSMETGATWDKKDLLKYSLPYSDVKIDIYFDKILPRLIVLARTSGDRRTKVIACEVLHAIVAYVLGKTSQNLTSNPDRFDTIYKILCPALLSLGCDPDEVVWKIFQPLMLQLTHWLSSKFMLESPATMYLIDSLFEGLSNESNSALREFSGMCLAEFTNWSIKQSDNEAKTKVNIHMVIGRMTNFALHPSVHKRVAAAIAFNHLYMILREDEEIVTTYWLEIFYCVVKSLDGCNDPSISNALRHVERVLEVKEDLLNAKHYGRRKPHEFEDATLKDAVNWLLTQCSCLDQNCRRKCMELFIKISGYVPNCDSAEEMIEMYINDHGVEALNLIIVKDLKLKIESLSSSNILPFLKTLDFYIWLIRNDLVNADTLFSNSNSKKEVIFDCARNFVHIVNKIKLEDSTEDMMILSKEYEDLEALKCRVIITMFDFLQIILNVNEEYVPSFFLNKDFFELISKCIMEPQVVGFNAKNFEILDTLPSVIENLLRTIMLKLDETVLNGVKNHLINCIEKHINDFCNLDYIESNTNCSEIKEYLKGLILLERCSILDQLYKEKQILEQPKKIVRDIFKVLAKERIGELTCANINPPVMDYLKHLMKFILTRYEASMTTFLVELIAEDCMLEADSTKIAHGMYFLTVFKDVIFEYMLKDTERTVDVFDELLQGKPYFLLTVTEDLLLFVQRHKRELQDCTEHLVDIIIKKFTAFERAVNNLEDRKQKLISIYGIAVHLKHNPIEVLSMSEEFYKWILKELMENSNLEYKIFILQNFLVCLTDMTSNNVPELIAILRILKTDRLAMCPNDFSEQSVKVLKVINCYHTLLSLLPVTRSIVVFESIILFAAGVAEHLCNEKATEYLQKYFNSISREYRLKSLEVVYKLYMNSNTPANERFDVLYKFLVPAFQFCKTAEIEEFFERNINEIHTIIRQGCVGTSSDIKQLILSKIGCFDLVGIMFARIHIRNIDNIDSIITRNAVGDVKTGKELLQNLYSCALNVRTLKTTDIEHKEIMRLLHCSAYNCSIAIVCLKEDENSYLSIFAENRKREQFIWENIVDCDKQYGLQQTLKEYPKNRKKLINIRKSIKEKYNANQYSYIHSYNLSNSTLNEDINAYDFNEMILREKVEDKEESMSLTFEGDDLDNHECMASICGALTHIISKEISVPSTEGDIVLPKWLKCFSNSLILTSYNNVRLFMLKVILNMQSVFIPYAKFFLSPIMHAVYYYLKDNQLNYVITDVIMMLINWHTVALPTEENDKSLAQRLWEIIIQRAMVNRGNEITKAVYKYNLNMVKTILEVWYSCLKLPRNLNDKIISVPGAAVYLILICFVNGMEKEIIERQDVLQFLEKSLENWQNDEETVLQTCECFGLILKHIDEDDNLTNKKCAIIDKFQSILRKMQSKCENRQMKCIRALCKNYPKASMIYFDFLTPNMFRLDALGKANCLEILLLCFPNLSKDQVKKELGYIKFHEFLRNKILPCEKVALRMIKSLAWILEPPDLLLLINLVPPYANHNVSEYREHAYDICMNVYKKFSVDTTSNRDIEELLHTSKEILLKGLLDPAEELQEKLLNFWSQDAQLTSTCKERLLEILSTYTPNVGYSFLPFILLIMLDLTKKSMMYTQKMFEPLHDCTYKDYKIAFSWRTKNLGSMAPLFAPSLASQMNQTFTQMSATAPSISLDFSYSRPSRDIELELQATQELEFEPTFLDEEHMVKEGDLEYDGEFKVPRVPEPVHHKKSRRFLSSSSDITAAMRQKEIKKNIQRDEMIKEETMRQRSSVKLYRKYRIGDFPDIEISHSNLIEPIQQLAKKDQLICKDLTVSIICSLLKEEQSEDFLSRVSEILKNIVESHQGHNFVMSAVLEILLSTPITECSPELIAKISKSNSLNFLGSLVLEECLIYRTDQLQPLTKKPRTENGTGTSNKWLQLASLYESMNDVDVVLSIFQSHIHDEDMREAAVTQAANDWVKAKAAYEKAYERETEVVKEHCLQGLFECLSNLCSWNEIDKHIQQKLGGDLNNIWTDTWRNSLFPWLFEVYVRKLLHGDDSDSLGKDIQIIESWLNDEGKVNHIKRFHGEESAMFFLHNQLEVAREFLINTLDEMREQWIRLHPLSTQLRIRNLQKLRTINDVNLLLKTLKTAEAPCEVEGVLKFWSNTVPTAQDAILPWDKLTSYRLYFSGLLSEKLDAWEEAGTQIDTETIRDTEENVGINHKLRTVSFNIRLKMIEAALNQKNKFIAQKYLPPVEQNVEDCPVNLKHQFRLARIKVKYLKGEVEPDAKKKLSHYASAWKQSHNLVQEPNLDPVINIGVRQHVSKIASKIVQLSEDETFANFLTTNNIILKEINAESRDVNEIRHLLEAYSFSQLKICCDTATTNIKECFCTLSKYCYDKLSHSSDNIELSKEFINSTLKAMSYGSLEAAHYFPCLLKPEYFEDEETKGIFEKVSNVIQPWLFLSWQAQLFSHLGTSIAPLIVPILERIVETYPNAVIYTFRLTMETNPVLLNDTKTYKIRRILYNRPEIEQFLTALGYVVQPELYLRYYLIEFTKNLSLGVATAVDTLLKKVYPNTRENKHVPKPGNIYNEIAGYKNKIKELERKKPNEIKQRIFQLEENIKKSLCKRKDRLKLKDYSPWLHEFSGGDLEVPGQYSGNRKPMPQYHAKIMKIEPTVKVMQSLRKPIRLTMVGNDAKEYNFLIKFGEDLRLDQRLQQLFSIMNKTLQSDAACSQRRLSIDTYQVIPLSRSLGLIQWIDDTRSLQELIHFTLTKSQLSHYDSIHKEYDGWIRSAAPSKKQYEQYKEATLRFNASKVVGKMNEFISKTECDSLRRTLTVLCPSPESFVTLRRNFITTYATMCIAHWILGIGDRHLGNILVTIGSGRCLGIDFGLAFGAGIDLRVPELMPFRLTPQILGLLKPFGEKDLLGAVMIHALRALRNEQGPILACMEVFVHEPLNWTEHVNKELKESEDNVADVKWLPKKKISVVTKKLNGCKPSLITLEQLKDQHNDKYFDRYYAIVTGDDDIKRTRATMENDCLSPEKQVECLLDQATDLNILGRTFVGWKPWL